MITYVIILNTDIPLVHQHLKSFIQNTPELTCKKTFSHVLAQEFGIRYLKTTKESEANHLTQQKIAKRRNIHVQD